MRYILIFGAGIFLGIMVMAMMVASGKDRRDE